MQDTFIHHAPQVWRVVLKQHFLAQYPCTDLGCDLLLSSVRLTLQDSARVIVRLEQTWNHQRLVPAQGLSLFLGLGPAVNHAG